MASARFMCRQLMNNRWYRNMIRVIFSALVVASIMNFSAAAKAQSASDKLQNVLSKLSAMQADFSQRVISVDKQLLDETSGRFFLSRPGKFKWDYADDGQKIISDGKKIYFYNPDLEQVIVRSLKNATAQVPSLILVANDARLDELFAVKILPTSVGLQWYSLTPKSEEATYQQMKLGFVGGELSSINIVDGLGQTTQLQLSAVQTRKSIASKEFAFEIPEGADVINDF